MIRAGGLAHCATLMCDPAGPERAGATATHMDQALADPP